MVQEAYSVLQLVKLMKEFEVEVEQAYFAQLSLEVKVVEAGKTCFAPLLAVNLLQRIWAARLA